MKRLTLLTLALALVAGILLSNALKETGGRSPRLPVSGLALPARAQSLDDPIVRVDLIHASGLVEHWGPDGTSPTASATPPPTNTPRPTIALTPTVTGSKTPWPTITPTATFEATPTRESTPVPTVTPGPTLPPPPTDCFTFIPSGVGLNVRSNPSIISTVYATVLGPRLMDVWAIYRRYPEDSPQREEWAAIQYNGRTAYLALWFNGTVYSILDDTPACFDVPVIDITDNTAMAWHSVLPGVDLNDMGISFSVWAGKGIPVAAKGVEETHAPRLALAYGGIGAIRFKRGPAQSGDCANIGLFPGEAALDMARRILPIALTEAPPGEEFWIEVDNECEGIYFTDLSWLDSYLTAEIRAFSAYYPGRVIFGTMLAGSWTEARVKALEKTWAAAIQYGACLGIHAGSPLADYDAIDGLRIEWLWRYSWQHRDIRRWLVELDPRYATIPMCVTEWASGGGWAPFRPTDYYTFMQEARWDGLLFVAVFTSGQWGDPRNGVNGKMAETARLW